MNDADNYKRRRKQSFPDEDNSCSNDHKTNKEDFNDMNESSSSSSIEGKFILDSTTHKRRTRTVPENLSGSGHGSWWDECSRPDYPVDEFRKAFRMSKSTFEFICFELDSVKLRVAVCIFLLATGEPLRLVSERFCLCVSTCHQSVIEICSAICHVLMPKYLRWPDVNSLRKIKGEFQDISWIPNVVGSMYTTHVPITPPEIRVAPAATYFNQRQTERNQKTSYSVTVQGVVDSNGVFTDVSIGWPGSMNDDQVLEKSALYQRANDGLMKGVWWVVGSKGYPLMDWVLIPYNKKHLTWTQHGFNEKIGEVQRIAKDAFGRLKGRWCCLQKKTEFQVDDLSVVIGACCVLHNICEMRDEGFDSDSEIEFFDDEMVPEIHSRSVSTLKARDSIAHNLLHHAF